MQWFRLYVEARNDAKLRSLTDAQFRVWFNLLCYASEQHERGVIEAEDVRLLSLEVSGGDMELLDETCNALQALRIVSCVSPSVSSRFIAFLNFEKRQGQGVSRNAKASTERVRKYRERQKMRQHETHVTHETQVKRDETHETPIRLEERRLEEKRTDPLPPTGGGVCVSINGGEPIPIEDAPKPAAPQVDEAELTRVGQRAEKLFPMLDFGIKIRGIAGDGPSEYPLAWIDAALTELHAGSVHTWRYLLGILRRMTDAGGPKSQARANSTIPTPAEPVETPEQKAARFAKLAEGMKAHMAQLAQEGRRAPRQ